MTTKTDYLSPEYRKGTEAADRALAALQEAQRAYQEYREATGAVEVQADQEIASAVTHMQMITSWRHLQTHSEELEAHRLMAQEVQLEQEFTA